MRERLPSRQQRSDVRYANLLGQRAHERAQRRHLALQRRHQLRLPPRRLAGLPVPPRRLQLARRADLLGAALGRLRIHTASVWIHTAAALLQLGQEMLRRLRVHKPAS